MKAGRELDAAVAYKVMGCWNLIDDNERLFCGCDGGIHNTAISTGNILSGQLLPYSTNIEAAWLIVEKLKQFQISIDWHEDQCIFSCKLSKPNIYIYESAKSATHAICLAALKAVEKSSP